MKIYNAVEWNGEYRYEFIEGKAFTKTELDKALNSLSKNEIIHIRRLV